MRHLKLFENFNIDSLKSLKSFSKNIENNTQMIETFVSEFILKKILGDHLLQYHLLRVKKLKK